MDMEQVRDAILRFMDSHDDAAGSQSLTDCVATLNARLSRAAEPVVPVGLVDALRRQRQVDEDGTECGVSRQAVDEAITILESLTQAPEPRLRALIETWRIRSEKNHAQHERTNTGFNVDWESYGRAEGLSDCADELEAAMEQEH